MFNQVLVTVLNKTELLDKLLREFENAGVSGATVVSSVGMAHALAGNEESHFISSFRALFDVSHTESKTIFIVCSDEMAEKAKEAVRKIVGDLSEPVSQATLRIVKVFWGLSAQLAYKRHFPAIDWLTSYSLYSDKLNLWFDKNVNEDWEKQRAAAMRILQEEASLDEIVRLVGMDALSQEDRLTMETAKSIREDYLHQNAFHEVDTFASLEKQYKMLRLILLSDELGRDALARRVDIEDILALPVREEIGRSKYIPESEMQKLDEIENKLKQSMAALISEGEI